jgi:hypothetical protein
LLKYIWQLPQHLFALLILKLYKKKIYSTYDYKTSKVYVLRGPLFGVSLGKYIIISTKHNEITVKHEYGHSLQSLYFGPLYLLIIGIPSATMNFISSISYMFFNGKFAANYYKRWPESWADKLGEVIR